jgi:DUF1707 SHOCT-like domain
MPVPSGPRIRASDADRDRVAQLLQEHCAAGRLTTEEFSERMEAALGARTLDELDELLADLPHADLRRYELPDASLHRPPAGGVLPAAGPRARDRGA